MAASVALAAPGDLDKTFAGTGSKVFGFGLANDRVQAIAVQADGKLVLADSDFSNPFVTVARLNTDGSLDTAFGVEGKVITTLPGPVNATALRIQSDGKIIFAGTVLASSGGDFFVVRQNADGSPDSSFGTNGVVITDFGGYDEAHGMVIQQDGKIVVAGGANYNFVNTGNFALARYNVDGTLDTSFGSNGKVQTGVGAGISIANAIMIQRDGKLVAAGKGFYVSTLASFAVARYNINGTPDTTFDGDGQTITPIGGGAFATSVALQLGTDTFTNPDKIVVAGNATFDGNVDFAVARYNLNGSPDTTFSGDGIATTDVTGADYPQAVLVQGTGRSPRKITVVGYSQTGLNTNRISVTRFSGDGSLDSTFDGDGKLTLSFGAFGDEAYAIDVQAGNIVVAGLAKTANQTSAALVLRLNDSGSLDNTFDADGVVTLNLASRPSNAQSVALQTDGKIVVAGSAQTISNGVFAIARLNVDGSFDHTFGGDGTVMTAVGVGSTNSIASAAGHAVAIQTDGKILLAGSAYNVDSDDFALTRYNSDGSLDGTFDGDGKVLTAFSSASDGALAMAIQTDGKIILAGNTYIGGNSDFAVARYNANGSLDASFDGDGKAVTTIGFLDDSATAIKIQPNGKIVVAGITDAETNYNFAVVRYNSNGSLDSTFGAAGRVSTDIAGDFDFCLALALQPDGKILAGGATVISGQTRFALLRYNVNGSLDTSFDGDGKVLTAIGSNARISSLQIQPDGRIVAAGGAELGGLNYVAVVRYNANGSLDLSYGSAGKAIVDVTSDNDAPAAMALDVLGRPVIAGTMGAVFGVLRLLGEPFLRIQSIERPGNNLTLLEGLGIPGAAHTMQSSTTLSNGSFGAIGSVTPNASGVWQFQHTSTSSNRFYRLSLP
ncbi:MAG TPA: hypothetical protein VJ063_22325 [Verrucomicrobiae bacterium]|nr:hypothetical protein [Verrucomicrobiae bacterium]